MLIFRTEKMMGKIMFKLNIFNVVGAWLQVLTAAGPKSHIYQTEKATFLDMPLFKYSTLLWQSSKQWFWKWVLSWHETDVSSTEDSRHMPVWQQEILNTPVVLARRMSCHWIHLRWCWRKTSLLEDGLLAGTAKELNSLEVIYTTGTLINQMYNILEKWKMCLIALGFSVIWRTKDKKRDHKQSSSCSLKPLLGSTDFQQSLIIMVVLTVYVTSWIINSSSEFLMPIPIDSWKFSDISTVHHSRLFLHELWTNF